MFEISRVKFIAFNFIASVLDKSTMLVITMLVLNMYSADALGYLSLLLAAAGLISAPGSSGIASFIMYYIENSNRKDIIKILLVSIILSLTVGLFYFCYQLFFYQKEPGNGLYYLALVLLLALSQVIISNLSNFIRAIGGHDWILVYASMKILVALCILYPAFLYKDFDYFVVAYVVYTIACVLMLIFISIKINSSLNVVSKSSCNDFGFINSQLLNYSSYIMIASLISSFGMLYVKEYISNNEGMSTLGYFTIAQQMSLAVVFGASSIGVSLFKDLKTSSIALDKLYLKSSQLLLSAIMFFCVVTQALWIGFLNIHEVGSVDLINYIFLYFCFSSYIWMIGPMLAAKGDGKIYVSLTAIRIFPIVLCSLFLEMTIFKVVIIMTISEFIVYCFFTKIKGINFNFLIDRDVIILFITPLIMSACKVLYKDFPFIEGMYFLGIYLVIRAITFFKESLSND